MRDFTLTFTRQKDASILLRAESAAAGEDDGVFTPPFSAELIAAITRALEPDFDPTSPQDAAVAAVLTAQNLPIGDNLLETVGDALDAALRTSTEVAAGLDVALATAQGERRPLPLTLRFGEGCDEVTALPWELLRHDGRFLVADNSVVLLRTPLAPLPLAEALGELPLRILLVLSEPLGASPIAPRRQSRELAHGLRDLAAEGAVLVDELRPPTYETLIEAVRIGDYHVVHFYGHGVYHEGRGHLLLEDPYGGPHLVPAEDIGAVLNNSAVRLVAMGACQSAMGGMDAWSSTAAALLRAGVPLVVGMQVSMRVDAAQAFTRQFYLSLAAGKDTAQALGDARLPLRQAQYGRCWFTPALYSRARGDTRLFDPEAPRIQEDAVQQVQGLHSEVERLEEAVARLGQADSPTEMANLRKAQEDLRTAEAALRKSIPGGYRPVRSPLYGVPPQNPHFVGRVAELRRVAQGLEQERPTVIWGLGGIGKTALAIEVVRRQSWRYPAGVLWLRCQGGPPLDSLLIQMAAFCGHPEVAEMAPDQRRANVRALLAGLERCLLVWDNAEDVWGEREARSFIVSLPPNCSSLLTTREDPEESAWPTIELRPLADEAMRELFFSLGAEAGVKVADQQDLALIDPLLGWLEGHPLALKLAVRQAKKRGLPRLWADLQAEPLKGVAAALAISYKRLAALPRRVFTHLSVLGVPFGCPAVEALLSGARNTAEAVDTLVKDALFSFDGRAYSYHALVRQYAYEKLRKSKDSWREAHRRAAEYLREKAEGEGVTPMEALEEVDQWAQAQEWETMARYTVSLVGSLDRQGYWSEITQRLSRALEAARIHLHDAKVEERLLNSMGNIALRKSDWDLAVDLYERALEISERLGDQYGIAQAFNNLGIVYADRGEGERAISMYKRSLAIKECLEDAHGMGQTLNNLGILYARKGKWDQAIEMFERDLEIEEQLGNEPGTAETLNNLGLVYADKGEFEQAIAMYERSLSTKKRIGDIHGLAPTWVNLGSVYYRKGEWDQAIEMYERSLAICEKLGDRHGMAKTWSNLGNVHVQKGEYDRAVQMYEHSLAIYEHVGDLYGLAQMWSNLGFAYARQGAQERAIEMYERSLTISKRLEQLPALAQICGGLGTLYADKGEWGRAIEMLERSQMAYERLEDMHGIAQTWGNLGIVYAQQGEWVQAIEMHERSLAARERLGDLHGMAQTWVNLGLVYMQTRRVEEARALFARAYLAFSQMASPYGDVAAQSLVEACESVDAANAYLEQFAAQQNPEQPERSIGEDSDRLA